MKYSLRQLAIFVETARHANISKAAEHLHLSQSAASSALKELESQYSIQLFDRVGKRLLLNDLGRALRPKAQALLDQAEALEHDLLRQSLAARLTLGATLTIGNYLAVKLLLAYRSRYPNSDIHLEVDNTQHIIEKLVNFELDAAMIEGEISHPELDLIPWQSDELIVFCAQDNPLALKSHLTDLDLINAQWILREPGSGTRQTFDRAMHGLLSEVSVSLELQHTEAIKEAVKASNHIGCLSRMTLVEELKSGRFCELKIPQRKFDRMFYLVVHHNKFHSQAIDQWMALCHELGPSFSTFG
ncbi:LysR family transcriptional regulator [Nitrincola tibetensis]|uniref:LysR family transcriptional regulator n=1 Tax=Nitrincola tibetensis TaxID=2219697 RepID=A0A364NKQ0_9GAMM|nr:LysR substrate-binding domain-containing protein [Nitrincola tibetensis]RAU17570.1 LysR family transcriptional regulator [Nitrincola tibetensis]